jgi:hypothetical protein
MNERIRIQARKEKGVRKSVWLIIVCLLGFAVLIVVKNSTTKAATKPEKDAVTVKTNQVKVIHYRLKTDLADNMPKG